MRHRNEDYAERMLETLEEIGKDPQYTSQVDLVISDFINFVLTLKDVHQAQRAVIVDDWAMVDMGGRWVRQ